MRERLLGHTVMGLVSIACVFVGEVPYSLVPLAVYLYVTLPTRSARRPSYVRRFETVPHAPREGSFARRRALLREAEEAVACAEHRESARARTELPAEEGRGSLGIFEETFEETFR